jgi:hypothetical protein
MTATYATLTDLRGPNGALDQFTTDAGVPDESRDTLLQVCLDDAQAIIDGELGFPLAAAAVGTQVVYGNGTAYLLPPPHTAGSVTAVTAPTGYTVPTYVQRNGVLVTTDASGLLYSPVPPDWAAYNPFFSTPGVWAAGVPYTVVATFGAAAADLLVCRRITLELSVQLWRFRDSGGSSVQGTETAVITVKNAFSPVVKGAIERLRQKYGQSGGIW